MKINLTKYKSSLNFSKYELKHPNYYGALFKLIKPSNFKITFYLLAIIVLSFPFIKYFWSPQDLYLMIITIAYCVVTALFILSFYKMFIFGKISNKNTIYIFQDKCLLNFGYNKWYIINVNIFEELSIDNTDINKDILKQNNKIICKYISGILDNAI